MVSAIILLGECCDIDLSMVTNVPVVNGSEGVFKLLQQVDTVMRPTEVNKTTATAWHWESEVYATFANCLIAVHGSLK